jgi:hypothetical protein
MSTITAQERDAIERWMRYASETECRLAELKTRTRNAKHFLRRKEPEHAAGEIRHLVNEAQKLLLHLDAWGNYLPAPARSPAKEGKAAPATLPTEKP